MTLDSSACYRALKARDARFDGRFFVAVRSTRVYCRPICTAKTPKREGCTFFSNAAAAESSGYRPCLRCRPELAPGNARVDATARLASATARAIERGALDDAGDLAALAVFLGTTDRNVRRAFKAHFGVSPVAYAQTQRLLMAKRLLTDTALGVTEIAFASGFGSVRRFNTLFRERYRLNPSRFRTRAQTIEPQRCDAMAFELAFRPPYDWDALVGFLAARTIDGVEDVAGGAYRRTVRIERSDATHAGWVEIAPMPGKAALRVHVSASLVGAVAPVLARVKELMDLAADPHEIAAVLGPIAARRPGLRVPGAFDGFEVAVRAVLGQQISVRAARTLASRFAATLGSPIATPFAGMSRLFPRAADVAALDVGHIAALGVVASRARTIVEIAKAIARGQLALVPTSDVEATLIALRAIAGVGEWTAQYIAMRAMGWPDAFPHSDLGLRKALGESSAKRILAAGEAWRPWRAYAAMHLWHSLA